MPKTGTYIFDKASGSVIKVSENVPILKKVPDWHRTLDGDRDRKKSFQSLSERGKLNSINDEECRPVR